LKRSGVIRSGIGKAVIAVIAVSAISFFVYKAVVHINARKFLEFQYTITPGNPIQKGYILMAPYVTTSERFSRLVIMDFAGNILRKRYPV